MTLSCGKEDLIQGSECPHDRGNIQNLELMVQDQPLSNVELRLELVEVGVPVRNQIFSVILAQDELMLSSLLT